MNMNLQKNQTRGLCKCNDSQRIQNIFSSPNKTKNNLKLKEAIIVF